MKNTFVKVLSFVMALMMVVGTFGTLAVFADAHEHTKGKLVSTKDATCVAYGYSTYLCGECGEEWETDVVAPSKNFHEYVDVEEVKASCLTDAISAGKKCKHCNDVLEGCKPSEGTRKEHYFVGAITPATCDAPETLQYTCNICNQTAEKIYADGEFMAAQKAKFEAGEWNKDTTVGKPAQNPGHTVLTWNVVTAPSQTATECLAGLAEGYCEQCKTVVRTAEIPAIHTYESLNKDNLPCVEWDASVMACKICGVLEDAEATKRETYGHGVVKAFSGEVTIDTIPLRNNGKAITLEELAAKGIVVGDDAKDDLSVEATCRAKGKQLVECQCGELYWKETDKVGHNWTNDDTVAMWEYNTPASCTDAYTRTRKCYNSGCTEKEVVVIIAATATAHNMVVVPANADVDASEKSREPNCTTTGYTYSACTNEVCLGGVKCNASSTTNFQNAKGHSYGAPYFKADQADKNCQNGVWEKKCAVCNVTEVVSNVQGWQAPACKWGSEVTVKATCMEKEYKYTPCTICGAWMDNADKSHDYAQNAELNANNHVYPTVDDMKAYANGDTSNSAIVGWVSGTASTCTTKGELIVKCVNPACAEKNTISYVEAPLKNHAWLVNVSQVTWNNDGVATPNYSKVDATCSTVGYEADGKICSVCKATEKKPTEIKKVAEIVYDAANDVITSETHKGTVTKISYTAANCKNPSVAVFNTTCCGIVTIKGDADALGAHDFSKSEPYKAPTCVADGNHAYTACVVCGLMESGSMKALAACGCGMTDVVAHDDLVANDKYIIAAIDHNFKEDKVTYKAVTETCDQPGYNAALVCDKGCFQAEYNGVKYNLKKADGSDNTDEIKKLNAARAIEPHYGKYMQTFKAADATCTSDAIKAGDYCTKCQKDEWFIAGTKTEHVTEQFEANLKPISVTIPEDEREYLSYDEYLALCASIPGCVVVETDTVMGEGREIYTALVSYTAYDLKDCTKDGCIVVRCKNCPYYETTFVEAKNTAHKYPANFTEDPKVAGYVACKDTITESKKCADCDATITQPKTAPTGHFTTKGIDGGEKFFFDYACNKINDYKAFKCDTCGVAYTELVKTLIKHNLVHLTKNATCTEEGFEIIECKNNCGLYETVNKTLPTTNNTGKHSVDHAATVVLERVEAANGVDGYVRYICGVCKQTTEDVLKADAALNTTISAGSEIVAAGSEIKIDVKVSTNAPAFSQLFFAVNAADFELVDVELVADFADANVHADLYKKNDTVGFVLYTENNAAGETVYATLAGEDVALVTLTLAVKQYATAGNIAVSAQYAVIGYEENGAEKNATFADNGKALTLKIAQTGDLNADGIIGVVDLQALIPQITKLVATGSYDAVADVNKDGTVDQFDIAALRQFMKNGFTTAAYLEMIGEDVDAAIAALKITDVADSIRFAKFVDDKLADKYETFLETRSTLNEYIADLYLEYATPASEQAA